MARLANAQQESQGLQAQLSDSQNVEQTLQDESAKLTAKLADAKMSRQNLGQQHDALLAQAGQAAEAAQQQLESVCQEMTASLRTQELSSQQQICSLQTQLAASQIKAQSLAEQRASTDAQAGAAAQSAQQSQQLLGSVTAQLSAAQADADSSRQLSLDLHDSLVNAELTEQSLRVSLSLTQAAEQKLLAHCTELSARSEQLTDRLTTAQRQSAIKLDQAAAKHAQSQQQVLRFKLRMRRRRAVGTARRLHTHQPRCTASIRTLERAADPAQVSQAADSILQLPDMSELSPLGDCGHAGSGADWHCLDCVGKFNWSLGFMVLRPSSFVAQFMPFTSPLS